MRRVRATLGWALLAMLWVAPEVAAQASGSTVWLVRHAERADAGMADTPDPELSAAGHERARELARLLGEAGLTSIHSTDYHRTRQTAGPIAEALGLEVHLYDPSDEASMARLVAAVQAPGRHLIVGHSNTTPAMADRLGGDAVSPISEMEYDRLYLLRLTDGAVETSILRFGAPAPGSGGE
ncbi:SixA phosphatase family protein [Gaopeijia maritima]|uniref:Histidine phosphatase family protein n=1 Tax=Gaopeijia maritima TaxID=3119007 RepID=A0ABU9EB21_9BACT